LMRMPTAPSYAGAPAMQCQPKRKNATDASLSCFHPDTYDNPLEREIPLLY
jgi:hypothetical protein